MSGLQRVQCALYQCAAPAVLPEAASGADSSPSLTALYDGGSRPSSAEFTPSAEDYRGDCMLFADPDTTYGSLIEVLQARLNTYMILHGPAEPHAPASAPKATQEEHDEKSERDVAWPWCRKCHTHCRGHAGASTGAATAMDTAMHQPTICVRHAHRLDRSGQSIRTADLSKLCTTSRTAKATPPPRLAIYFCLLFLPASSPLRGGGLSQKEVASPSSSASASRFLHLKAAGHTVRLGIDGADTPVSRLIQSVAVRRHLEVTRVVVEEEPEKPAIFPCESAAVLARAVPCARVVVNKLARVTDATRRWWSYGDVRSVVGSHLAGGSAAAAAAASSNSRDAHNDNGALSVEARRKPTDTARYYGPYAGRNGVDENGTIISYSSFGTASWLDDRDDMNTIPDAFGDARISLGDLGDFSGLSSESDAASENAAMQDEDDTVATTEEEAFIASLGASEVNSEAESDEESGEVSVVDHKVASACSSSSSSTSSSSASSSSSSSLSSTAGDESDESVSSEEDVEATAPLNTFSVPSSAAAHPRTSDALWNLNNDFVFEVDDSSMSPPRAAETGNRMPSLPPTPSGAVLSPSRPSVKKDAPTHTSSSPARKPRLVVVSSPPSYQRSSHSGSSGLPTPAHPPRPFRPEYTTELRWHFSHDSPSSGLLKNAEGNHATAAVWASANAADLATDRTVSLLPRVPSSSSAASDVRGVRAPPDNAVISIVDDPTVAFSQTAASPRETVDDGEEEEGEGHVMRAAAKRQRATSSRSPPQARGSPRRRRMETAAHAARTATASRSRSQSASNQYHHHKDNNSHNTHNASRANVLDETPVDIPLQQAHESVGANVASSPSLADEATTTPPTVRQPRRRSPIFLTPGDFDLAADSSAVRHSPLAMTSPYSALDAHSAISPVDVAPTPLGAVAYFRPPIVTPSHAVADHADSTDSRSSASSVSREESPLRLSSHAAPLRTPLRPYGGSARATTAVMVTQQAIPEYTLPDGNESSSGASHSDRLSDDEDDEDDEDDASDGGEVLGGEKMDGSSDDSDYVFTGL